MLATRTGSLALSLAAALTLVGGAARELRAQSESTPEPAAQAAPVARDLPPMTMRVSIALASESETDGIDPKAQDIYDHLPAKFHSIHMVEDRDVNMLFGEQTKIALPAGNEMRLLPVGVYGNQLHMQLEMPNLVNTSMRMANSRAFYFGGPRHDGKVLVFKLVPQFSAYVQAKPTGPAAQDVRQTNAHQKQP